MLLSICLTSGGTIHANTVSCLFDSLPHLPFDKYVGIMTGGYKQYSLSLAVKNAKANKATHIMFIDCDMIFPPDGIKRLIEADKEIIGAAYNERRLPLQSTVKLADETGKLISGNLDNFKETFEVYALGLGFLLCQMSVFDKIQKPYFNAPIDEADNFMTDDFYFCDKVQKQGIKIYCDPNIILKHEGNYLY